MNLSNYITHLKQIPAIVAAVVLIGPSAPAASARSAVIAPAVATVDSTTRVPSPWSRDTLVGRSGKLWMKLMTTQQSDSAGLLAQLFGDSAWRQPGVYAVHDSAQNSRFNFVYPFYKIVGTDVDLAVTVNLLPDND